MRFGERKEKNRKNRKQKMETSIRYNITELSIILYNQDGFGFTQSLFWAKMMNYVKSFVELGRNLFEI
jgi:hypothetical protein